MNCSIKHRIMQSVTTLIRALIRSVPHQKLYSAPLPSYPLKIFNKTKHKTKQQQQPQWLQQGLPADLE